MTVEITSVSIEDRIVTINAIDVTEENLQRMERIRDDGDERELTFMFDLRQYYPNIYLNKFLHRQKAVREAKPKLLIEALNATVGTVTSINGKYRDWERAA